MPIASQLGIELAVVGVGERRFQAELVQRQSMISSKPLASTLLIHDSGSVTSMSWIREPIAVYSGASTILVHQSETHDMEPHVDVADLADLKQPV
ncbi:MAG: hypothetical protein M3143_04225 [Actinomycetota bacterium]|nr:hypothetical protein [Actinomycetota bacterium]